MSILWAGHVASIVLLLAKGSARLPGRITTIDTALPPPTTRSIWTSYSHQNQRRI
jgi:hypothetical protein